VLRIPRHQGKGTGKGEGNTPYGETRRRPGIPSQEDDEKKASRGCPKDEGPQAFVSNQGTWRTFVRQCISPRFSETARKTIRKNGVAIGSTHTQ